MECHHCESGKRGKNQDAAKICLEEGCKCGKRGRHCATRRKECTRRQPQRYVGPAAEGGKHSSGDSRTFLLAPSAPVVALLGRLLLHVCARGKEGVTLRGVARAFPRSPIDLRLRRQNDLALALRLSCGAATDCVWIATACRDPSGHLCVVSRSKAG